MRKFFPLPCLPLTPTLQAQQAVVVSDLSRTFRVLRWWCPVAVVSGFSRTFLSKNGAKPA